MIIDSFLTTRYNKYVNYYKKAYKIYQDMTYITFLENRIPNFKYGEPIFISELAREVSATFNIDFNDASAAVSVAVKRIIKRNSIPYLRFYKKGVYFITKSTPFGEVGINKESLIKAKYLNNYNGYETGFSFLNHLGLTTLIPKSRVFATNKSKSCIRMDNDLGVQICPPKVPISVSNWRYLQILDAIDLIGKAPIDAINPYSIIAKHIADNNLDYGILLSIAGKHYSRNALVNLANVAGERM